jgi:hypothetical protein
MFSMRLSCVFAYVRAWMGALLQQRHNVCKIGAHARACKTPHKRIVPLKIQVWIKTALLKATCLNKQIADLGA